MLDDGRREFVVTEEQVGRGDDSVERGADFVADVGEEVALGSGGLVGAPGGVFEIEGAFADEALEGFVRCAGGGQGFFAASLGGIEDSNERKSNGEKESRRKQSVPQDRESGGMDRGGQQGVLKRGDVEADLARGNEDKDDGCHDRRGEDQGDEQNDEPKHENLEGSAERSGVVGCQEDDRENAARRQKNEMVRRGSSVSAKDQPEGVGGREKQDRVDGQAVGDGGWLDQQDLSDVEWDEGEDEDVDGGEQAGFQTREGGLPAVGGVEAIEDSFQVGGRSQGNESIVRCLPGATRKFTVGTAGDRSGQAIFPRMLVR